MRNTTWIGALAIIGGASAALALGGCGKHEKRNFVYMPDMNYTPSYKAQEPGSMRTPVEGTLFRDQTVYAYKSDPEGAGRNLRNPLPMTKANLLRGQDRYNTYCIVCHGPAGEGDGFVVPKFPRPPSLQSDKVKGFPDGRIFHIITAGQNLMPSYASQIPEKDRWAIVNYLHVLHRAKNPTQEDLKAYEQESK